MNQGLTLWGWISLAAAWGVILVLTIYCFSRVLLAKKKKRRVGESGGRAQWASRIGLILAMAGNAIGLGNFLRFPVKAAANGGGAFMIPYFCALLFLGIPLMWVEWSMGRHGGVHGHGTTPGMFALMWKHPAAKYLGALGISLPFTIVDLLQLHRVLDPGLRLVLRHRQVFRPDHARRHGPVPARLPGRGAQPVLRLLAAASSSFLPSPSPQLLFPAQRHIQGHRGAGQDRHAGTVHFRHHPGRARPRPWGRRQPAFLPCRRALAYMWNPDFSQLSRATVWLVAAGQIFFTLSLGQGIINTYASYLREKDDVTLNGLSTSMTNEFAEVILGGTIAIPVAVAFFGVVETKLIASEGAFNLGFQSLPVIFQKIPLGQVFGAMWFFLLFIAGITSSVAMTSPAVAFLEDEFKWKREKAVNTVFAVMVACAVLVVAFFKFGFLDELDFWAGTFGLVVFATIEIIIFSWIFGVKKGWEEMHIGADLKVPRIFKFILKYVTPVYMLVVLGAWTYQEAIAKFLMKGEEASRHPYLWGARAMFVGLILLTVLMVWLAWRKRKSQTRND